ncbi:hypothetical protein HDU91_004193, partial [Kappamyces sp. JEL0680]
QKALGWLKVKGLLGVTQGFVRQKAKPASSSKHEPKRNQGPSYKDRLKEKMMAMVAEEENALAQAEKAEQAAAVDAAVPEPEKPAKLRIGTPGSNMQNITSVDDMVLPKIEKEVVSLTIPLPIERFMVYDWCPLDKIMHPEGFEDSHPTIKTVATNSKGKSVRMPKIGDTADDLFPIVLSTFDEVPATKRTEVFNFLKWLFKEYGFHERRPLIEFLAQHIVQPKIADSEDVRIRLQMIEMLLEMPEGLPDLFLALLPLTLSMYNNLKQRALQILRSMGAGCIQDPFIVLQLEQLVTTLHDADTELQVTYSNEEPRDTSTMGLIRECIHTMLYRFLMATARSLDIVHAMAPLSVFGKTDRAKEAAIAEASGRKKKGKTGEVPPVADLETKAVAVLQSVKELAKQEFPTELNPKLYPMVGAVVSQTQMSIEAPEADLARTVTDALQEPNYIDYVDALNFCYVEEQERLRMEEEQRLEQERQRKLLEEAALAEQQKRALELAERARIAAEREAVEEARKERIRLVRLAKRDANHPDLKSKGPAKSKPKIRLSEMTTKGVGHTHHSHCHHSREDMDVSFRARIDDLEEKYGGFINSSLTVQLKTINKSMPMEQIKLEPFEEGQIKQPPLPKPRTGHRPIRQRPPSTAHSTECELEFIRGSHAMLPPLAAPFAPQTPSAIEQLLHPTQAGSAEYMLLPNRRYFVPTLAFSK